MQKEGVQPVVKSRFVLRPLKSEDFHHLQQLEEAIWASDSSGQLCPYYLRLCTEFYAEWCFIAFADGKPVGYVLNFPKGKINYCATLAVLPEFQKTRVSYLLIRAMVSKLLEEDMEECRFLVEPENTDARDVHQSLGARVIGEVQDYYHKGDRRLISVIAKHDMDSLKAKYSRMRLVS